MLSLLWVLRRVMLVAVVSMGAIVQASAHETQPAVSDVMIDGNSLTIRLVTAVEPIVAGVNLDEVEDTDDSPLSGRHDQLRAEPPAALAEALNAAWPSIANRITLRAGETELTPVLSDVQIPEVGDVEVRRDSVLTLTADLPDDGTAVVFGWDAGLGGLIVRQGEGENSYDVSLTGGALTEALPREGVAEQTMGQAIARYVISGFDHIIPKGLDHILFVLGLYFYALAWRPLLWQVTAFTAAHTVTLAMATLGIVQPTMWIIEALIALSIVWIAVENVMGGQKREIGWTRIAVVFGFGLLHGLGFASVLSEFGLGSHFVASLISFNIGVEIGQLTVIAVAFLLLGLPFGQKPWYRKAIVIPGSLIIATIGAYWVLNRIGFVGDLPYLT